LNPSVYSNAVTFTATVSAVAPATGVPAGTVEFFDGTTSVGAPVAVDSAGIAQLTVSTLTGGLHAITAQFTATDVGTFGNSISNAIDQTVEQANTSVSLEAVPVSPEHGQSVTFTATVASFAGVPTGTVEFFDSTTSLGSAPLDSAGHASISAASLTTGSHDITGAYAGDTNFVSATSDALSLQVSPAATSTAVIASPSPSVFGQPVSFTATVSAVAASAGIPSGTVQFYVDNVLVGTPVSLNGAGVATSGAVSNLTVGPHSIDAWYSGDPDFLISSDNVVHTIDQGASSTAVTSTPNPSVFGDTVTIAATVSAAAPAAGTPTGIVEFFDGGTSLGSASLTDGVATLNTSTLTVGTHPITATYVGDTNFTTSSSTSLDQVVNGASQSITFGVLADKTYGDAPFGVSASASSGLPVGFSSQTPAVCSVTGATVSLLGVGQCTIRAAQSGNAIWAAATPVDQSFTVAKASSTTGIVSHSPNPSVVGQSYAVTWLVDTVPAGAGTPTGTVTVSDGTSQCSAAVSTGSCSLASTSAGPKTLTASYAGDSEYTPSVSSGTTHTVNPAVVPMSISSVSPNSRGRGATNNTVIVTGGGFVNGATAAFSGTGVTVNSTTWNNANQLTLIVSVASNAALGTRDLTVTNPGGASVTSGGAFTVTSAPVVSSISPNQVGQGATNFTSVVTGSNFAVGSTVTVSGTGVTVNSANRTSATSLTMSLTVSATAALGLRDVTVINPDGGRGTCTQCLRVMNRAATVTSVSPNSRGQGASNQAIVITGANFASNFTTGGGTVSFGSGITVTSVTRNSATQLTVRITVSATATIGSRNVIVTNPGAPSTTLTNGFSVTGRPTITSLSPTSAPRGVARTVTINGTRFAVGVKVAFSGGGITVDSVTRVSSTQLRVRITIAANATRSARNVTVTNADGGTFTRSSGFTVT
jgi:hypothetical protein